MDVQKEDTEQKTLGHGTSRVSKSSMLSTSKLPDGSGSDDLMARLFQRSARLSPARPFGS